METKRSYRLRGTPDCPIFVGYFSRNTYMPPEPHWHPEIEILYVEQGHLTYLVEQERTHLSVGDILIFPPKLTHQYLTSSPDVGVRYLIFSLDAIALPHPHVFQQEFVQPLRDGRLLLPRLLQKGHPAHEQIANQLAGLKSFGLHTPNYKVNRYAATVAICTALLPWCTKRDTAPVDISTTNAAVRAALLYIRNNYFQPITLSQIAGHVHLHPSYLSTIFKKHTGQTLLQYLNQTRVDAAAFLLRSDDLNMNQITELTGFGSESVFFRQFKAQTGMTPMAYRKQHRTPKK